MTANIVPEKVCKTCKKARQLSDFSKLARSKDGLQPKCKSCFSEYNKQRYEEKKEEIKANVKRWKEENKQHVKEYRAREDVKSRANQKRHVRYWADPDEARRKRREWRIKNPEKWASYREANRERLNATARRYYARNRDEVLERQREAYDRDPMKYRDAVKRSRLKNIDKALVREKIHRLKNSAKRAAQSKAWREQNVFHVKSYTAQYETRRRVRRNAQRRADYAADPHPHRESKKRWSQANPGKVRLARRHRRARLKAAEGKHTLADIQRLFVLQRGHCPVCRKPLKDYHVDHVVALARGGSNDPLNLQLLHPLCNQRKNARDPIEFMQEQGFLL